MKWWALEALLIPRFDDVIVCSEMDRKRLTQRFPRPHWHVVPNIVPEPAKRNEVGLQSDQFTFLFVGQLGYYPNWDGVLFFCTEVLPALRRIAQGQFRVLIVGRAGADVHSVTAIDEVQVVIDPPEVAPYYAQSDAVIVQLRGGGGTRVKILEAFSYALPVISTTIGAEGLEVTPGSDILIADDAETFAEKCLRIWADDSLRRRIAAAGRDLWRRKYNPAALVPALDALYEGSNIRAAAPESSILSPDLQCERGALASIIRR